MSKCLVARSPFGSLTESGTASAEGCAPGRRRRHRLLRAARAAFRSACRCRASSARARSSSRARDLASSTASDAANASSCSRRMRTFASCSSLRRRRRGRRGGIRPQPYSEAKCTAVRNWQHTDTHTVDLKSQNAVFERDITCSRIDLQGVTREVLLISRYGS